MDIAGNKVILRAMEEQDREMLRNLIEDPDTERFTGGYSSSVSYEHQMKWFLSMSKPGEGLRGVIADRKNPRNALGIIILSNVDSHEKTGEIYIKLMKTARQRGYGQDAVTALVSYAFCELGLNHLYSSILEYNFASRRLFERCGFRQEKIHKTGTDQDGHDRIICIYGKIKVEP